ncbi:hypothetical protein PTMSG1_04100 [Pyrenophora teres f. maculata]|nr:hypothetical protein PTMSG1_04100 [Pyrenophora teres f. maculata]
MNPTPALVALAALAATASAFEFNRSRHPRLVETHGGVQPVPIPYGPRNSSGYRRSQDAGVVVVVASPQNHTVRGGGVIVEVDK